MVTSASTSPSPCAKSERMGLGLSSIKGQERATMEQRMSVGNCSVSLFPFIGEPLTAYVSDNELMIKWWLRVFSLHHFPYQVKNVQGVLSYAWYLRWLIFGCSTNIACHACLTELIQISRQCNIQNQIQSNEGSGSGWTPSTDWRNTEVCKYGNQSSWSPKVRPLETIRP